MSNIYKFIEQYDNKSTRENYFYGLNKYFDIIRVNPEVYFEDERDYAKDVEYFWKEMKKIYKSICTRNSRLNAVKSKLRKLAGMSWNC